MTIEVQMLARRPNGSGSYYGKGSIYSLSDDLATYFIRNGVARRTSLLSEVTDYPVKLQASGRRFDVEDDLVMPLTIDPASGAPSVKVSVMRASVPVAIPSSGSVGANGALTLTTALPYTFSAGVWLYFPPGAVFAGSAAGLYFAVMSSTTLGTVYANTYAGGLSKAPTTLTPIVAPGPGAYTQTTGADIDMLWGVVLPNTLGALSTRAQFECPNNANNKFIRTRFGSTIHFQQTLTTTVAARIDSTIIGIAPASQRFINASSGLSYGTGITTATAWASGSENTAVAVNETIVGQLGTATDYLILWLAESELTVR